MRNDPPPSPICKLTKLRVGARVGLRGKSGTKFPQNYPKSEKRDIFNSHISERCGPVHQESPAVNPVCRGVGVGGPVWSCGSGGKILSLMPRKLIFMRGSFEYSRVIGWRSSGRGYTLAPLSLKENINQSKSGSREPQLRDPSTNLLVYREIATS